MSQRQHPSRRTVLQTLGALGAVTVATPAVAGARTERDATRPTASRSRSDTTAVDGVPDGATQYVAVVDRIVDGEHVVLLLEDDGELVDQHVAPRSAFDDVGETDILLVVIKDDELLAAQHLPERPGQETADGCKQRTASEFAADRS